MFVHAPKDLDMRRLVFLRWLAEHGKLEHATAGPSSGPLVMVESAAPSAGVTAAA